jgi:hypothetical protein
MKKTLFALIASCAIASADDFAFTNGNKISGTLSRVEPDGLVLITDDGIEKIPFTQLSPEVRAKYGYKPQAAAQYSAKLAAAQHEAFRRNEAALQTQEQEKTREWNAHEAVLQQRATRKDLNEAISQSAMQVQAKVSQVTDDGALCYYDEIEPGGTVVHHEAIFIAGLGVKQGLVDDSKWQGTVYLCGVYRYTTVMGAEKTVKKYALSKETALQQAMNADKDSSE